MGATVTLGSGYLEPSNTRSTDKTPVTITRYSGYTSGVAATEAVNLTPFGNLSGTGQFHLTKAVVNIIGGVNGITTTAQYSLNLGGNTAATFYTIGTFDLDFGETGIAVNNAAGMTSTVGTVDLHMSCATKTACVGSIMATGYWKLA